MTREEVKIQFNGVSVDAQKYLLSPKRYACMVIRRDLDILSLQNYL